MSRITCLVINGREKHIKTRKVCRRGENLLKAELKPVFAHGGKRSGAGRKPRGPEPRERINVTLTASEQRRARWLGEGNVSLGIARALLTCPDWARKVE